VFFKRKREDADKIRDELINLIDNSKETIYKIAFYSNPEVEAIMNRLVSVWEHNNRQGRPIDYANITELKKLLKIAKNIVKKSPAELWAEYSREYTSS